VLLLFAAATQGCAAQTEQDEAIGVVRSALSPCDETVPTNRFIDGIPAYAQCATAENSAIYSNNGVDTSTTSMGDDWIRTQWSGGYQCTELAHRYLYFVWDVDWTPNGNAGTWCDSTPPASSGVVQTMAPVHGDVMVLPPGSCGASSSTGHVTVVDVVEASGKLSVVEQNRAARGSYELSCAGCFLHVVANDGSSPIPGAGGAGVAGMGAAGMDAAGTGAAGMGGAGTGSSAMPQAGAPAPEPTPTSPAPVTPPPAPTTPPPAAPTGMAGAPAPLPAPVIAPTILPMERPQMAAAEEGCSVLAVGAHGTRTPASFGLLYALLLAGAYARRRRSGDRGRDGVESAHDATRGVRAPA
jgi:hypothetical protein